jgi:hypothetical protein
MSYTPASISINVGNALKVPFRSAQERIEYVIQSGEKWPNFKLIERRPVTISGIQGEMVFYEVDGFMVGPKMLYQADAAFDYNGQAWDFELEADISLADTVKADFLHVIETFKILD